ncbi:MAG TPA: hypothetical protein VK186_17790 [Candidatus Deferrimicrobium sp.]|nr:hypothetical protein [Candidatus Kapabacteria bacterium]HLP60700.1 hypothetical protein [Candidatus Deferrimicrobium sp.]
MGLFIIKFFLTSIIFSLITGFALVKINTLSSINKPHKSNWFDGSGEKVGNLELMLYSLGLGPVFTVLILYYLLLVIHGLPNNFYLAAVFLVYLVLLAWGRKSIPLLLRGLRAKFRTAWMAGKRKRWGHILYFSFLLALLAAFIYLYLGSILKVPIADHDTLVHGNIGKMYYMEKAVKYSDNMFNSIDGFFFIGSPKPSFSLLLTWEMIMNRSFAGGNDLSFDMYFRSISVYYGLLILLVVFYWLYKKNRYLALLGILVLFSGLKFFQLFISYHLDSYRLFFLILSWIFLAYSLKNREPLAFFLLGVFSGFTAFTHLIGLLVALVNGLAFFIFQEAPFKERLLKSLTLGLVMVLFGGIHYILEALWGARFGFLTYF